MHSHIIPVILCGGSGKRLWPLSRASSPKQFLRLLGGGTMLQKTARRALAVTMADAAHVVSVTTRDYAAKTTRQLSGVDENFTKNILLEPAARGTAPAIAMAAAHIRDMFGPQTMMLIMPSDHHMLNEPAFAAAITRAVPQALSGGLVTFGINPTRPETGFGYIQCGVPVFDGVRAVKSFVEKPEKAIAQLYMNHGGYLWNSGIFLIRTDALLAMFEEYAPDVMRDEVYHYPSAHSFDRRIVEQTGNVAVVPCAPGWHDVGTWRGLWGALRAKQKLEKTKN